MKPRTRRRMAMNRLSLVMMILVACLVVAGCGGEEAETTTTPAPTTESGEPPEAGAELSESDRFAVARAKTAFEDAVERQQETAEARAQTAALIELCREGPGRTYGGVTVFEVINEEAGQLEEVAPALASKLRRELDDRCAAEEERDKSRKDTAP
jgi:hypothetical protein